VNGGYSGTAVCVSLNVILAKAGIRRITGGKPGPGHAGATALSPIAAPLRLALGQRRSPRKNWAPACAGATALSPIAARLRRWLLDSAVGWHNPATLGERRVDGVG